MQPKAAAAPGDRSGMFRLFAGLLLVWLAFDRAAAWLGSTLGQAGIAVSLLVIVLLVGVERWFFARSPRAALIEVGLGRPAWLGLLVAVAIAALMIAFFPLFAWLTGTPLTLREGWLWLVPGLFAQGGIAEEALFRGYLFGQLRQSRSFWRAALASVPAFLAVHLLLLLTMPAPIAASAALLSLVLSFPLAHLFELGAAPSGGQRWCTR